MKMLDLIILLIFISGPSNSQSVLKSQLVLLHGQAISYESGDNYYKWLFFGTLGLFLGNIATRFKPKKRKEGFQISEENTNDSYIQFNEHEKILIKHIIEHSKKQNYFTVAELNLHLGVKNKSIEIQKKIRTEAIIRINHKFNVNFNKDTVFIERVRSIEDRRYFNYFINDENIKTYLKNNP